jgi:hypothetical protein
MATGLQNQFAAASDVTFQQRVAAALAVVAVQVYTETPQPANHPARAAYAVQLINNPPLSMVQINQFGTSEADKTVYAWTRLLASQGLDNATASDGQIETQISNDFNAMANA